MWVLIFPALSFFFNAAYKDTSSDQRQKRKLVMSS